MQDAHQAAEWFKAELPKRLPFVRVGELDKSINRNNQKSVYTAIAWTGKSGKEYATSVRISDHHSQYAPEYHVSCFSVEKAVDRLVAQIMERD